MELPIRGINKETASLFQACFNTCNKFMDAWRHFIFKEYHYRLHFNRQGPILLPQVEYVLCLLDLQRGVQFSEIGFLSITLTPIYFPSHFHTLTSSNICLLYFFGVAFYVLPFLLISLVAMVTLLLQNRPSSFLSKDPASVFKLIHTYFNSSSLSFLVSAFLSQLVSGS